MLEIQELKQAQQFISLGEKEKAAKILWELYVSKDEEVKLDAALSLLSVIDPLTENNKLIEVSGEAIKLAVKMGKIDIYAYLLGRKSNFLASQLTFLIYRQRNLILAAGIFKWFDFSLKRDKQEYESIVLKRETLEKEIETLELEALRLARAIADPYLRGHIFMALGESYSSKSLSNQLDWMIGGRKRNKIANIYFVRRWGLSKFLIYDKNVRRKITESKNKCIDFFQKSIEEFKLSDKKSELAYAHYSFSLQLLTMYKFSKAKKYLLKAKLLAQDKNEKQLLQQIQELEKSITDKNKHIPNRVEEFGLDLP